MPQRTSAAEQTIEERICELEYENFEIIQSEDNKDKKNKRMKKANMISRIASKEPICELLYAGC